MASRPAKFLPDEHVPRRAARRPGPGVILRLRSFHRSRFIALPAPSPQGDGWQPKVLESGLQCESPIAPDELERPSPFERASARGRNCGSPTRFRRRAPHGSNHFNSRSSARPAGLFSSLASIVLSLSGSAALKAVSTKARYSSLLTVLSLSGSAAAQSLAAIRPCSSWWSSVPSLSL